MVNSLYIHIPFCMKKCIYCDFLSVPYDKAVAMDYINAVVKELEFRRESAGVLKTAYIGGGTPTTIPTLPLIRLLRTIRDMVGITPDAELTIEANPGTVTGEMISALSESGINRLSMGIQSFNDNELKLLGRIHDFSEALKSIAAARHAGITNLSIDLIYGIPGQTLQSWTKTVSTAMKISPEHISAYELTPEKNTPLHELISTGKLEKPDEETILGMYSHAMDRFGEAGYSHYEISNFSKPGFQCRHNLNYWNRGQYLGIGAGAHSFIEDKRIRNTGDILEYMALVSQGNLPEEEVLEISRVDAVKESIFLGLRKKEGLDIREFREHLDIDLMKISDRLIREGLLISDSTHLALTQKGIVISNTVITELFTLLGLG
ncbi:MAG TPA: radical SAM family heme chaperone HemW [Thermodesulfovibrionales bacterium]|nr:radical SAM family heme chaperone HemW [Thermodesulfovibrionales bacterium]